jgi:integrase
MAKQYTRLQNKTIFINPRTGEPYTGDQAVRKAFKRICQKAEVRYRYPYQMRHTYASSSLMAGEDLGFISKQLGHKSVEFTMRTYIKYIPANNKEAGNKFEEYIKQR